jgi:hypothetical protein
MANKPIKKPIIGTFPWRHKKTFHPHPYVWRRTGFHTTPAKTPGSSPKPQQPPVGGQQLGAQARAPAAGAGINNTIIVIVIIIVVFVIAFFVSGMANDIFNGSFFGSTTSTSGGSCASWGATYCSEGGGYLGQDGLCHCALFFNNQPLACSSNSGCDANSYCDPSYGVCLFDTGGSP